MYTPMVILFQGSAAFFKKKILKMMEEEVCTVLKNIFVTTE